MTMRCWWRAQRTHDIFSMMATANVPVNYSSNRINEKIICYARSVSRTYCNMLCITHWTNPLWKFNGVFIRRTVFSHVNLLDGCRTCSTQQTIKIQNPRILHLQYYSKTKIYVENVINNAEKVKSIFVYSWTFMLPKLMLPLHFGHFFPVSTRHHAALIFTSVSNPTNKKFDFEIFAHN